VNSGPPGEQEADPRVPDRYANRRPIRETFREKNGRGAAPGKKRIKKAATVTDPRAFDIISLIFRGKR
jgi:hypothetical protein